MKVLVIKSAKYGRYEVLYDDNDHDLISKYVWHVLIDKRFSTIYAVTNGKGNPRVGFSMHRLIMGFPDKKVDHKNHNGLDNRRSNLRVASNQENGRNTVRNKNNTSGYKGVAFHKVTGKFQARICVNYTEIRLGLFDTPELAAKAYDNAALKYFGEFANINNLL